MSNHTAIAAVTAILKNLLENSPTFQKSDVKITTVRPTKTGEENQLPSKGVNIFLYQNPLNARVNNSRRQAGELTKRSHIGFDLYYLFSFYGNENLFEPQKLMGQVASILGDYPALTPDIIKTNLATLSDEELAASDLAEQVEQIKLIPVSLSAEELSKIWSNQLQTPYSSCLAYQCTAVVIEGAAPGEIPLRVRDLRFYAAPDYPRIEQVTHSAGINMPILADSTLLINGKQLMRERTLVQIDKHKLQPMKVTPTQVSLSLKEVDASFLSPGLHSLQIVHILEASVSPDPDRVLESNVVAFVLCPAILGEVSVDHLENHGKVGFSGTVTIDLDLLVGENQRAVLLLNEVTKTAGKVSPAAYMFLAKERENSTKTVRFPISQVKAGEYLVRVQVDGAESLLSVDTNRESPTFDQYVGPKVTIS